MQKFKDALREEQKRLEEIIAKAKKENEHMPEGNLRISKHKNRCRYYHCVHDRNGIYIPKRNLILREQLAQKAYNSSIINIAEILPVNSNQNNDIYRTVMCFFLTEKC